MKKIFLLCTTLLLWHSPAQATDVGDIYYSDKTFSTNLNSSKMPIGVVFWANVDQTKCYVLALPQPADMNLATAKSQCANFSTLGTSAGNWKLPTMKQAFQMRTQQWLGVSDNKFTNLNKKLTSITTGQALKASDYWTLGYSNQFTVNPSTGAIKFAGSGGTRSVRCVMEVNC